LWDVVYINKVTLAFIFLEAILAGNIYLDVLQNFASVQLKEDVFAALHKDGAMSH
jgi:hypothetical protein